MDINRENLIKRVLVRIAIENGWKVIYTSEDGRKIYKIDGLQA